MPEFPIDTALLGVVGAVIAVAVKILLGKKRGKAPPPASQPPPADTQVHEAAVAVVQENFEDEVEDIVDANAETDEVERLERLAAIANKGKRKRKSKRSRKRK